MGAGQLVLGTQAPTPQTLATLLAPQVWPPPQFGLPQLSVSPQPSGAVPQFQPSFWQVVGLQPQTCSGPPPPHVLGAVQLPQLMLAPQPLSTAPQSLPSAAQLFGMH